MKKSIINGLVIGLLTLGIGFTMNSATANAAYRTVKTKSYASTTPAYHAKSLTKTVYMWNSTLSKKQHNLKNYPRTTWYLQKSVKLTNGKKTGIFYYLQNKKNTVRGYVWRGYLTKGVNGNTDPNPSATAATKVSDATLAAQMRTLFVGTQHSTVLDKYAGQDLSDSVDLDKSLTGHIQTDLGVTNVYTIQVKGISKPASLTKIKTQLAKDSFVRKNEQIISYNAAKHLNDFDGWYVGSQLQTGMFVSSEIILAK